MTAAPPSLDRLAALLPRGWSRGSAARWRADDPAAGQCNVTAVLAHELLGGEILKTRVGTSWHFYNRLDGMRHDLTASQFAAPVAHDDVASSRAEAMAGILPAEYAALRGRVLALLAGGAA